MLWQPNGLTQTGQSWRRPQGGGASAAYTNFIARTSGLDGAHSSNYSALLDTMTADGLFNLDGTSSYFDVLRIYRTQDSTTALLNLCGASYAGTVVGSPTFAADGGYTGTNGSSPADYINSNFNPSTAGGNMTQNSAHMSMWAVNDFTSTGGGGAAIGESASSLSHIYPRYSDGKGYYRINDSGGGTAGITVATSTGHSLANRSSSSAQQGYRNAVDQGITPTTSAALSNQNLLELASAGSGNVDSGYGGQVAMASIGGSLTAQQVTDFYNALRTYMTATGMP